MKRNKKKKAVRRGEGGGRGGTRRKNHLPRICFCLFILKFSLGGRWNLERSQYKLTITTSTTIPIPTPTPIRQHENNNNNDDDNAMLTPFDTSSSSLLQTSSILGVPYYKCGRRIGPEEVVVPHGSRHAAHQSPSTVL
jgi:hypothetical protein